MKTFYLSSVVVAAFVLTTVCGYAGKGINSGKPVPLIGDNVESAEFLAKLIEKSSPFKDDEVMEYAWSLAKTLNQFDAASQSYIWYGGDDGGAGGGDDDDD